MIKFIVLPVAIVALIFFIKKIIQIVRRDFFKDEPLLDKLDVELTSMGRDAIRAGKEHLETTVRSRVSESRIAVLVGNAAQMVTELLEEVSEEPKTATKTTTPKNPDDEAILNALTKMGFRKEACLEAIKQVPDGELEERLKQIITLLGKE